METWESSNALRSDNFPTGLFLSSLPQVSGLFDNDQLPLGLRKEVSDMENEDQEAILNILVWLLSSNNITDHFVSALYSVPVIKASLIKHITPSIEDQITAITRPLENIIDTLHKRLNESQLRNDDLEQYIRRQNVRITGIPETPGESTDCLVVQFAKDMLKVDLTLDEINKTYRRGSSSETDRDIIVEFVSYKCRNKLLCERKRLYKDGYVNHHQQTHVIREDLTKRRQRIFFVARQLRKHGIVKDVWIHKGGILIEDYKNHVTACTRLAHLPVSPLSVSLITDNDRIKIPSPF